MSLRGCSAGCSPRATSAATSRRRWPRAEVRVDAAFELAANHHNPMEGPATVAYWEGERLTLVDSTMGVRASQLTVAHLLGLPLSHVRVLAGFVGGSFGMKAMVWPHVTLTAMAARQVGRPVRLTLDAAAAVHLQRAARAAGAADRARRDPQRPPDRDPAREAVGHLAVRRLGGTGHGRQLAAVRVRALQRRAPADPRQHDDADVHARAGRGARRLHARVRDGRAGLRGRHRPRRAADAQPRPGRRPRSRVVERRPVGVPARAGRRASAGRGATRPRAPGATATG